MVSANELRLPVGEPVELLLSATDVIHSFWLPSIAGKRDMIPGQVNRLVLEASAPGIYRGQCAEYCGGPHALMAFYAIADAPDATSPPGSSARRAPAAPPDDPFLAQGRDAVPRAAAAAPATRSAARPADGQLGPDLTHLGSRTSLARRHPAQQRRHDRRLDRRQPSTSSPPTGCRPSTPSRGVELRALAAYLASLE